MHDVCCDSKEGGLGGEASQTLVWYMVTQISAPLLKNTSNATGANDIFLINFAVVYSPTEK